MYLTLEVVSPQAAALGAQRRRVVGTNGLTIGRVEGNDWVIPDPYISKQHARISYANGSFTIVGLGRKAIAVGKPNNAIPANEPHVLKNGDHVFIDQYDLLVGIFQGEPRGSARPVASADLFGIVDAEADTVARAEPLVAAIWEDAPAGAVVDNSGHLDPLSVLPGPPVPRPSPVNLQPDSPLRETFTPPAPRAVPPPSPVDPGLIPEGWDQIPDVGAPSAPGGIPANWDQSVSPPAPPTLPKISRPPPLQRSAPPPGTRAAAPSGPGLAPPRPAQLLPFAPRRPEQSVLMAGRTAAVSSPVAPAPPPAASPEPGATGSAALSASDPESLGALLRGAGLSEPELSPELLRDLGQVLRIVVQGVMKVLHARADINSQFHLPLTRVQARENNPLKLAPNVESALHTLLVQRNPGYLSTVPAFEEAFADICNHQMALLEGVRVAFASMLEAFDPQELRKQFDADLKRGGPLSGVLGAKWKYWDLYVKHFTALQGDAEDTFRRLFGDVFAQAYEQQLERLKSLRESTPQEPERN